MTLPNARFRQAVDSGGGEALVHWCPGCESAHLIYVKRSEKYPGPVWNWDGNEEAPTTNPSVRTFDNSGTICHYFLRAGVIEYCGDCRHSLSNQKVPVPDWPFKRGEYGGLDEEVG